MIWKLKLLELGGNGVIFILHDFNRIKCVYGFPQSWFCFRNTYFSSFIPRINESTERLWCSVFYAFLLPNRLKICPCLNKQPGTRDNCRKSTVKNYHNLGGFCRNNRTISFWYGKRWHIIDIYFKGEFQNSNVDYISNVIHSVMGLLALITQKKCNSEFKF